ncbi:MAG: TadE/TadG family type IV pilus assembly protein [Beijerinckiaceae bacterium]
MSLSSGALAIRTRLSNFRSHEHAIAAVEFALVLPFMVALLLGGIEISNAVSVSRKVTLTAHTVADLVTQYSTITAAQMSTILGATSAIMAPYSSTNLTFSVTEVKTNASSVATVCWSTSSSITVGSTVTLPTSLRQPSATYIWGQAQYTYTPSLGYKLTGPINIYDQIYLSPRLSTTIPYNGSSC